MELIRKIKKYGDLVMFSHTLFSLPFALVALVWAAKGLPEIRVLIWAIIALVAGRNAANGLNRVIDAKYDEKSERLKKRQIPSGEIKKRNALIFSIVLLIVFQFAAYMINPLCFWLAPFGMFLFVFYSYTKRFTWLCHLILGFTCGGAPVGAWFAVTGEFHYLPFIIAAGVMFWVAGFDIIYAMQDIEFDREQGLKSIPAKFGLKNSKRIAALFHFLSIVILASLVFFLKTKYLYLAGLAVLGVLLFIEHMIIKPDDIKAMNKASYYINQIIGGCFFAFAMLDFFLLGGVSWQSLF